LINSIYCIQFVQKNDLEEAPSAYKNIEEVMAQQADLVDVVTGLSPLAVIKG